MSEDLAPTNAVHFDTERIRAELDDDGRRLFEHWRSLRSPDGAPPKRAAIDPLDIPYALPGISLVDVRGGRDDYFYRLVGTRDVAERGNDPTGKKVRDASFANTPDLALANYDHARRGEPLVGVERFRKENGVAVTDVALFMPLTDEDGVVTVVMVYGHFRPDAGS